MTSPNRIVDTSEVEFFEEGLIPHDTYTREQLSDAMYKKLEWLLKEPLENVQIVERADFDTLISVRKTRQRMFEAGKLGDPVVSRYAHDFVRRAEDSHAVSYFVSNYLFMKSRMHDTIDTEDRELFAKHLERLARQLFVRKSMLNTTEYLRSHPEFNIS